MSKLFKIISQNKKSLFLVLGIGLFLSFLPLHNAQAADIWTEIWDAVKGLPDFIAGEVVWVVAWPFMFGLMAVLIIGCLLSYAMFFLSLYLLKWVASGYLVTLPFTSGGIVDVGWQATLSIANLGFVLVLVFIALSTILRLENYGMKKLLPKFILVIILINFSGVICGMVVDVANAITRSFLNFDPVSTFKGVFTPIDEFLSGANEVAQGNVTELFNMVKNSVEFSGIVQNVTKFIVAILFGLFSSFTFFLYFLLFLLRYIAIWILVILAPIAWFCWILPDFRNVYQSWEKYFIQWAFIGVIAGFFLKLGAVAVTALSNHFGTISTPDVGGGQGQEIVNIFSFLFTSLNSLILGAAVLIFLVVGFIISLKSSGGGTEMVLQWGKKGLDNAGNWALSRGKTWAGDRIARSERVQNIANRMATAETPYSRSTNRLGRAFSERVNPIWSGIRAAGKAAGPGMVDAQKINIEKAEKDVEKSSVNSTISKFRSATDGPSRVGYMNRLIKQNDLDEAVRNGLDPNEIARTLIEARRYDAHRDIISAMPHLDQPRLNALVGAGTYGDLVTAYREEVIDRVKPARAGNLSESVYERTAAGMHAATGTRSFDNPELLEAIVRGWDGRHYSKLYETHGPRAIAAIEDRVRQLAANAGAANVDTWLQTANPRLLTYKNSSAGRQFFNI